MMSNEITIKIDVSDGLLAKLLGFITEPEEQLPMGLPAALLGAMQAPPIAAEAPKERAKVGFKIKNKKVFDK